MVIFILILNLIIISSSHNSNQIKNIKMIDIYNRYYIMDNFNKAFVFREFYDETYEDISSMKSQVNSYLYFMTRRYSSTREIETHQPYIDADLIHEIFKSIVNSAFFDKNICDIFFNLYKSDNETINKIYIKMEFISMIISLFEENGLRKKKNIVLILTDLIIDDFKKFDPNYGNNQNIIHHIMGTLEITKYSCEEIDRFLNTRTNGRLDYLEYFGFLPSNLYLNLAHKIKSIFEYFTLQKKSENTGPGHLLKVEQDVKALEKLLEGNFIDMIVPSLGFIYYALLTYELIILNKNNKELIEDEMNLFVQTLAHVELFIVIIGYIHDIIYLFTNEGRLRFCILHTKKIIEA